MKNTTICKEALENISKSYLEPIYCSQKSFYKKAIVKEIAGVRILQSYETDVAAIDSAGRIRRLWDGCYILKNYGMYGSYEEWTEWTATTGKHIREFANQNGFSGFKKADYVKLPVEDLDSILAAEIDDRTGSETEISAA